MHDRIAALLKRRLHPCGHFVRPFFASFFHPGKIDDVGDCELVLAAAVAVDEVPVGVEVVVSCLAYLV